MPDQQGISFLPSGISLVLGLVLIAAAGVLCWTAWRRTGYRKATGMLELLRFALVCLVVATLCQPEWLRSQPARESPTLAVLWDQSNSMKTRDVIDDGGGDSKTKSRAEAIGPLLDEVVWKPNDGELNVVFEPFSSQLEPAEDGTDLNFGLS